jgi:hypothetical protein
LPGAFRDAFYVAGAARVQTGAFTAVMHSPDAPVLHPGAPALFHWHTERSFKNEPPAFYWQLYHNMLITDCPAWQDIHTEFNFSLYLFRNAKPEVPAADTLQAIYHHCQVPDKPLENTVK